MKKFRIAIVFFCVLSIAFHYGYRFVKVIFEDNSYPQITTTSQTIYVSINDPEEKLLEGVTAFDNKDGDVTDSLIVEKLSEFDSENKRKITYAAFDSDNHVSRAEAYLVYNDYVGPRFSLSAPLVYSVGTNTKFIENFTCTDSIDGDITHKIKVKYNEDEAYTALYYEGIFDITLTATNSCGDTASLTTYVEVKKKDYNNIVYIPNIILSDYIAYVDVGAEFNARDYLSGLIVGKNEYEFVNGSSSEANTLSKQRVNIDSDVDTSIAGQYSVRYTYTTNDGYKGSTELIVIVQ